MCSLLNSLQREVSIGDEYDGVGGLSRSQRRFPGIVRHAM